jgi:hypothetical protein
VRDYGQVQGSAKDRSATQFSRTVAPVYSRNCAAHRAGHQRPIQAPDVGELCRIDLVALVPRRPAENCEVSNRNVVAGEFDWVEPIVEHTVKPSSFLRVALDAVVVVGAFSIVRKWLNCWGIGPKPPTCHTSTGRFLLFGSASVIGALDGGSKGAIAVVIALSMQ